jgi:hypothetical protein
MDLKEAKIPITIGVILGFALGCFIIYLSWINLSSTKIELFLFSKTGATAGYIRLGATPFITGLLGGLLGRLVAGIINRLNK